MNTRLDYKGFFLCARLICFSAFVTLKVKYYNCKSVLMLLGPLKTCLFLPQHQHVLASFSRYQIAGHYYRHVALVWRAVSCI